MPKRIKYISHYFDYSEIEKDYYEGMGYEYEYLLKNCSTVDLNDEIEIIEEDKKIEKINYNTDGEFDIEGFTFDFEQKIQIVDKINEIIDYINKGDK